MDWIFKFRDFLNLAPVYDGEKLWRELTEIEWKEAYKKNLVSVLKEVQRLVDDLEGKIIVTSDHGEALGEDGIYLHPIGVNIPV